MAAQGDKKRRKRSPNYPAIELESAVARLKVLHDSAKMHPLPAAAVHKLWGYEVSSGNLCIAALKAYGLVETTGSGEKRKVQVSDRGRRIALDSSNKNDLLQKAAVTPMIHAELWKKYQKGGLPPNATIQEYLVFERDGNRFNEDVVAGFIERFRKTISFAKLDSSGILEKETLDGSSSFEPPHGNTEECQPMQPTKTLPLPVLEADGSIQIVHIPHLSEKAFDFLKSLLDTYKAAIVRVSPDNNVTEADKPAMINE